MSKNFIMMEKDHKLNEKTKIILQYIGFCTVFYLIFSFANTPEIGVQEGGNSIDYERLDSLKRKIVFEGDVEAYSQFETEVYAGPNEYTLPYDLIMANRYKESAAYMNAFTAFYYLFLDNKVEYEDIDSTTKSWMLELLVQGSKLGDPEAIAIKNQIDDYGTIKDW